MNALADAAAGPLPRGTDAAASPALAVQVFTNLADAEAVWRRFEREAVATPFQRYDWVAACWSAGAQAGEPRIALVSNAAGRPQMLLPLALETRHGLKVASIVGGKQASFHAPLMAPGLGERLPERDARSLLRAIGHAVGADALAFSNMPLAWRGERNLLAGGGQPSPSFGWRLPLEADGEAALARAFSKDTRKKFRKKEKKLAELGPVAHRLARSPAEVDSILAAFFDQKRARREATGLENPFESGAQQAFLRAACRAGLAEGSPAIELHALMAGERVAAEFGAASDANRCCGMFISFDGDPEVARSSPGELLLIRVITQACEHGLQTFDLGVGEATYKSLFCDEPEPLVDLALPITLRGRAYAFAAGRLVTAKRFVKQTPWAWRTFSALRKSLGRR